MAKTVLVVDDEEPIRILLTKVLEEAGYQVLVATTGLEALKLIDKAAPDLVISDINMPDLDGLEMATGLRNHDTTKKLPIIFVTASENPRHFADSMGLRARFFLRKPFSTDKLVDAVRMAVGA